MISRKIIQISACQSDSGFTDGLSRHVYALCNDGTVWLSGRYKDLRWELLPDVPQELPKVMGL